MSTAPKIESFGKNKPSTEFSTIIFWFWRLKKAAKAGKRVKSEKFVTVSTS